VVTNKGESDTVERIKRRNSGLLRILIISVWAVKYCQVLDNFCRIAINGDWKGPRRRVNAVSSA
jgi:hypothetical protein